MIQEDNLTHTK